MSMAATSRQPLAVDRRQTFVFTKKTIICIFEIFSDFPPIQKMTYFGKEKMPSCFLLCNENAVENDSKNDSNLASINASESAIKMPAQMPAKVTSK
jgi:hypothetical protein